MGVTPLMWKSLNRFGQLWNHFWTSPLQWDPQKGILVYTGISRRLVPWATALYLLSFPLVFIVFLLAAAPIAGPNRLPCTDYIVNLTWLSICYSFLAGETFGLILGQKFALATNSLAALHKKWEQSELLIFLCRSKKFYKIKFVAIAGHPKSSKIQRIDFLGLFLHISVIMIAMYPYLLLLFALIFDLDPLIMLHNYWLPSHIVDNVAFKVCFYVARILQLIPIMIGCQFISRTICLFTVVVHTILSCIDFLDRSAAKISNFRNGTEILLQHKILEIILKIADELMRCKIALFMWFGTLVSVLVNFVTLKLHHVIPLPMYLIFCTMSMLIPCVFAVMLPMTIDIFVNDTRVHDKMKYYCHQSWNIKLLSRQIKGTKVLRAYSGLFSNTLYALKQHVKPRYFYETIYYTITALLSIPV